MKRIKKDLHNYCTSPIREMSSEEVEQIIATGEYESPGYSNGRELAEKNTLNFIRRLSPRV